MSFFNSNAPEEDDILYGWEFHSRCGGYYRIYQQWQCAPFPRPAPSYQQPDRARPLYVKNLAGHIDEYLLECMFSPFGTVTGTKIFWNRCGVSKGFGLVWFANDREAEDANYWMDGRPIEGCELYVAPAEYWEDRQDRLAANNGWYDDDHYEEDESYENYDYFDDDNSYEEEVHGNQAFYDDRNHCGNYQPAPTAYYDDGRNHGNYQPNTRIPSVSVAYYYEGTNGHGYHDHGNPQPVQQPQPAPKQEPAPKPVYQQQTAVIVTQPRGPPPMVTACCCGTCNTPGQELKLALAGSAAA